MTNIKRGTSVRVRPTAQWCDMSPLRYGTVVPAEHRGEVGVVVDFTDQMPDVEFPGGERAGYKIEDLEVDLPEIPKF